MRLVESVPVGLYPTGVPPGPLPSVSEGWLRLLGRASGSLSIAGFYVTLRDHEDHPDPTDAQVCACSGVVSSLHTCLVDTGIGVVVRLCVGIRAAGFKCR